MVHVGLAPTLFKFSKLRVYTLLIEQKTDRCIEWMYRQENKVSLIYSRISLSRTRLFRITAYLEEKIWSLF